MAIKKRASEELPGFWFARTYGECSLGGLTEIRAIDKDDKERVTREWVNTEKDYVAVVNKLRAQNHIYFGVSERKRRGGFKKDVLGTTMLWAEVDTGKLGWEDDKVLSLLHSLPYKLRPSACVSSGYGYHLYWFLNEALEDQKQIEDANKVLCEFVSSDNVWNCDRILRVPGSVNYKYGAKKEVEIVWCYHWSTHDVHELIDGVLEFDHVLYGDAWITTEDAKNREKLSEDNAARMTHEDRRKSTTSRHEAVWELTKYGGGPGWHGIDEAITLYTAGRVCRGHDRQLIFTDTLRKVKGIHARDASAEEWSWQAEEKNIWSKIARWEKKWPAIKAELDERAKAQKRKMKEAQSGIAKRAE